MSSSSLRRAAILHMRHLEPGWDSYGAKPIDPRCIEKALQYEAGLYGDWSVVPCSDGGIQFESHADGFDIEIRIARATVQPPEVKHE